MRQLAILLVWLWSFPAFGAADLRISDLKADVEGSIAHVSCEVSNLGPGSAEHVRARIYLYSAAQLRSTQETDVTPLSSGESRVEKWDLTLAEADLSAIQLELFDLLEPDTTPSSNQLRAPLRRPGINLANLGILECTVESEQPVRGKDLEVNARLLNRGPQGIPASTITASLQLFQEPVAVSERRVGKVPAGEEREVSFSIRIPPTYPSQEGLLFVEWKTMNDAVQDPFPGDNTYSVAVSIVPRMPDLLPLGVKVDGRGELHFVVKNKGNAPAGPTVTALYANGALVRRFNTPELSPGAERRHQYGGMKIPTGTQLAIVTDFNADVEEGSEENNRFQFVTK